MTKADVIRIGNGVLLVFVFVVGFPILSFAHNPDLKKNASFHATVVSVENSRLKIRTEKGLLLVKNASTAPIFQGREATTFDSLEPGMKILIAGSMLPARLFSARSIVIEHKVQ